jgi:BASS family bile acid:Na+ symporter
MQPHGSPVSVAPLLGWLNRWFARNTIWLLLGLVALNLLVPRPGLALKDWRLFRIPGVGWSYDFATLALTLMMLPAATQCRLEDFAQIGRRPRACAACLFVIYALAPALALGSTWIGLGGFEQQAATELRLGIFLVSLMPVAMTASIWVRLATGNVALLLAVVAVTTTLSVVTVPLYSHLMPPLAHEAFTAVPVAVLVRQLVLSVVLPLAAGLGLRRWASQWADRAQPLLSLLGNLSFLAALSTNVAGASARLTADLGIVAIAAAVTLGLNGAFFALTLLWMRWLRARRPGLPHGDAVALLYGGGMRSTGTAMVLTAAAYPGMSLATVPAAIYSISQQILGGYLSRLLEPGSALLLPAMARGRKGLDARLRELASEESGNLALIVFRVHCRSGRPVPLLKLMPAVRRRLRPYDYVALLGHDRFAVLVTELPEAQAEKIALRVDEALRSGMRELSVRWGIAEASAPCPASRLVDLASERALGSSSDATRAVA